MTGALLRMQGWACAYCGNRLDTGLYVDHFRPRRHYSWLSLVFSNLLLTCGRCNTGNKGSTFPVVDERLKQGSVDTASEQAVLLDPTIDEVDAWFSLAPDGYQLVPATGLDETTARRVRETIRMLQLNVDIELRRARRDALDAFLEAFDRAPAESSTHAVRFRAMSLVPALLLRERAPHALPDARAERTWLLRELLRTLAEDATHLGEASGRSTLLVERTRWALAFLLVDLEGEEGEVAWRAVDEAGLRAPLQERVAALRA